MHAPQQVSRPISIICISVMLALAGCGGGGGGGDTKEAASANVGAADQFVPSLFTEADLTSAAAHSEAAVTAIAAPATVSQPAATPSMQPLAAVARPTDAAAAAGAIYYVDSQFGADANTGTQAIPGAAGAGPWRTLSKLTQSGFAPGDTIRLACGSVWNETLRLNSSGTAGNPITVAAASSNCIAPPRIDGSVAIPAASWTRHIGSIYRTTLSRTTRINNLITNGNFTHPSVGWSVWSPKNDAVKLQQAACGAAACMKVTTVSDSSLLSSNSFALQAAVSYNIQFSLKAPLGTKVRTIVRRAVAPYESVGFVQVITGNGSWQTINVAFPASTSLGNARLDFEVPASGITVQVANAGVIAPDSAVTPTIMEPLQLTATNGLLVAAHHPNQGYDATQPASIYLRSATDSDRVSSNGQITSTYLATGSDLKLPVGATIPNGTTVRIRTNSWTISESKTTGYSGSRISLATPTTYPITAGWGYFLVGQLWMLDSAGEWLYDKASTTLYAWMPDGAAPIAPVLATYLPVGIEASGREYTVFDGIAVRYVGVGVNMSNSIGVVVRNLRIEDTAGQGVVASAGLNNTADQNVISRTGSDAITAVDSGMVATTGMQITNNRIDQSGVMMIGEKTVSLPVPSSGAIRAGYQASVVGNTVIDTSYAGIWVLGQSSVRDNHVRGACTVLDDCGGIYTIGGNNGSIIANNIVERSRGSVDGKPTSLAYTQAQGIYLDELASGVTVEGNSVMYNDYGIQLHDAANNTVQGNKLYGNRLAQLWLQEQGKRVRASGDVYGNVVKANQFVPTTSTARGFKLSSEISSTALFGSFDFNRYFDRIYSMIGTEWGPLTGIADYTIGTWKAATTTAGLPRLQDANGHGASEQLFTTYLVSGTNIVPNGKLAVDTKGWTSWNQTAPAGTLSRQACAATYCAVYTAGGSDGLLSSPNFSVLQGQWYRLSVDVLAAANGQSVSMIVRRGGGGSNGYEGISGYQQVPIGTTWRRFSVNFRATTTVNVNDPITADLGARVDFQNIKPGTRLSVSNVELIPITSAESLTQVDLLVNTSAAAIQMACPAASSNPAACAVYARMSDDAAITWPYLLAARSTEVIYTRDSRLADVDGDGIADSRDLCPNTPIGLAVGADGCSFSQRQ